MKKYVVKNKNTQQIFGKFDTKNQAAKRLVDYVCCVNEDASPDDDEFLCIFDFDIQEQEEEYAMSIESYEQACVYLELIQDSIEHQSLGIRNQKHSKALSALGILFTIAEAWNKADGFVPDFDDDCQHKFVPLFTYMSHLGRFVFLDATQTNASNSTYIGSRLCFASYERAKAFGEKFENFYNDFLSL